jgi:hypothetical protein
MILDPDDSNLEIKPTLSAQQTKLTRKGKNEDIKEGLGGLTNVIEKLADKVQSKASKPSKKCTEIAMEKCSTMFANELSNKEYISFISVLEHENKARTFLTLARSSTSKQCLMWLKKEADELVSSSTFSHSGSPNPI